MFGEAYTTDLLSVRFPLNFHMDVLLFEIKICERNKHNNIVHVCIGMHPSFE